MPVNDRDSHRTLQDDRSELGIDSDDDSPLVKGEGAPLAEDEARVSDAEPAIGVPGLLGGAPVPVPLHTAEPASHAMTAAEDRPIND